MTYHLLRSAFALVLVLSSFHAKAIEIEKGNIKYHIDEATKSATVLSVDKKTVHVVIPETIEHEGVIYTVTKIGSIATDKGGIIAAFLTTTTYSFKRVENIADFQAQLDKSRKAPKIESFTNPKSTEGRQFAKQSSPKMESITIPNSVTVIGDSAFAECRFLKSIVIPGSVTSIGDFAFLGCTMLSDLNIEEGVKHIGVKAFRDCTSLKSVVIPNSVTHIGEGCFYQCPKLSSVTLGDGVIGVPKGCFSYCEGLKIVKLGKSVNEICDYAFSFCEYIEDIYIYAENPPQTYEHSLGTLSYTTLHVPDEFSESYKAADPWRYAKKFVSADK